MNKTIILSAGALASCAHPITMANSHTDWCKVGYSETAEGPWNPLEGDAVTPVAQDYLSEALSKLTSRSHIRISERYANKIGEFRLKPKRGEVVYLARAGLLGGPAASVRQYLANNRVRIEFGGEVRSDGRKLVVHTFSTSLPYPSRKMAVVVRTKPTIVEAVSYCRSVT